MFSPIKLSMCPVSTYLLRCMCRCARAHSYLTSNARGLLSPPIRLWQRTRLLLLRFFINLLSVLIFTYVCSAFDKRNYQCSCGAFPVRTVISTVSFVARDGSFFAVSNRHNLYFTDHYRPHNTVHFF